MENTYDVDIYKDSKKEWRWKVESDNGNIIGSSTEGYKNKKDMISNIKSLGASLSNYTAE